MNPQAEGTSTHISKQFNSELEDVKNQLLEMGGAVEQQLADALVAMTSADSAIAAEVLVQET
jgi:phosphate transport system protein